MIGPIQPDQPWNRNIQGPFFSQSPGAIDPNASMSEQQLQSWINQYVAGWVQDGQLFAKVNWNNSGTSSGMETCSESIAYAMRLLAANPNLTFTISVGGIQTLETSQNIFDGIYTYARSKFDNNGLMNWEIDQNGQPIGLGSATDADCDMAFALIQAHNIWGDNTGRFNYGSEAQAMLDNIRAYDTYNGSGGQGSNIWSGPMLNPGDGWGQAGQSNFDASYVDPFTWSAFSNFDHHAPKGFWNQLTTNCLTVITGSANPQTGLIPDWCNPQNYGAAPNYPNNYVYGFDACRVPFRLAEYLANVSSSNSIAQQIDPILTNLMNFFMNNASAAGSLSSSGYALNGTPLSTQTGSPAFDGPVAAALSVLLNLKLYPPEGSPFSYRQCYNFATQLEGNVNNYLNNIPSPYSQPGSTPYYNSVIGLLSSSLYTPPPPPS